MYCKQRTFATFVLLAALVTSPTVARADCVEDMRRLDLGSNNVIRLRSFSCSVGSGQGPAQVKIEFHRLSEAAASAIIGRSSSDYLTKALGSPRLIENEVFKTYAELLSRFGTTIEVTRDGARFALDSGEGRRSDDVRDSMRTSAVTVLKEPSLQTEYYPALDEALALTRKNIPRDVRFYYSVSCQDGSPASSGVCRTYHPDQTVMTFWRPMGPADVENYSERQAAYNRQFRQGQSQSYPVSPRLRLAQFMAGSDWPEDFLILSGSYQEGGCGAAGWTFGYTLRGFIVDTVLVQNISNAVIDINGIWQSVSSTSKLRVSPSPVTAQKSLRPISERLAPGERLLIPTKITLVPAQTVLTTFGYRQTANNIHQRLGANGFSGGGSSFRAPSFRNYLYGPEVAFAGLSVNNSRIDLSKYSPNFVDLSISPQWGSCPFLASKDPGSDEWINHGKILHAAHTKGREYVEHRSFEGFRSHFRIEEREPEIAYIDQVELTLKLQSGRTISLRPDDPKIVARDEQYLQLSWGSVVDLQFKLPDDVSAEEVAETELTVTGYYISYSDFEAQNSNRSRSGSRSTHTQFSSNGFLLPTGQACMLPISGGLVRQESPPK